MSDPLTVSVALFDASPSTEEDGCACASGWAATDVSVSAAVLGATAEEATAAMARSLMEAIALDGLPRALQEFTLIPVPQFYELALDNISNAKQLL